MMLKIKDKIPLDIQVKNINGENITLKEYLGKYLVLYFYPKDLTSGCTVEACEFRDYNKELKSLGAEIVGISKDPIKLHKKFKEIHKLDFTLLSDEEHKLQEAFGVWLEKSMYGRKYMGTARTTFLVSPEGEILHIWEKVTPQGHAKEVFLKLKELI